MTTEITPHDLGSSFDDKYRELIVILEGDVRRIYSDSKGIPTMGIGYALFIKPENAPYQWRLGSQANLEAQLLANNISLLPSDWGLLQQVMNALNNGDVDYAKLWIPETFGSELKGVYNAANDSFGLELTQKKVDDLFDIDKKNAAAAVKAKIGQSLYDKYTGSTEMVAMMSLALNNPILLGDNFLAAFKADDRAEAWYEIRYDTNGGKNPNADSGEAGPRFRLMPGHRSGVCRAGGRETGNALSMSC